MITRIVAGVAVVALVALLVWAYGQAKYNEGRMSERAAHEKAMSALRIEQQRRMDAQSAAFEAFRSSIPPQKVERELREVFRNVPIDPGCGLAAGALSVLQDATDRANAAATGQSGDALPDAP